MRVQGGENSSPELMDHCAVGNMETFANLLERGEFIIVFILEHIVFESPLEFVKNVFICKNIVFELPQEHVRRRWDICTSVGSPTHQEHPRSKN